MSYKKGFSATDTGNMKAWGPLFNLLVPSLLGLLPKWTASAVKYIVIVSVQSYDLACLTITCCLYGQLVTQSLDILWSDTEFQNLTVCQEMLCNGETFSTAETTTLLQNLRDLCWNFPTVNCQTIHTSFLNTGTSSTMELSGCYDPSSMTAWMVAWTCCEGHYCVPKLRLGCLQSCNMPTKLLCFLGWKAQDTIIYIYLRKDHWTPKNLTKMTGPSSFWRIYLLPCGVYMSQKNPE